MNSMKQCMMPLVLFVLLLSGCGPGNVTGVSTGGLSWTVAAEDPIPGIHKGAAEVMTLKFGSATGVTIVVWCAGANGTSSHSSAGSDGAFSVGHFRLPDEAQVGFRCETNDGTMAKVMIAGHTYDTRKGSLFLISRLPKEIQVKQLDVDISNFPKKAAAIKEFAMDNPDVSAFFTDAKKQSKPAEDQQ